MPKFKHIAYMALALLLMAATAQAGDMQKSIEGFQEIAPLVKTHCKTQWGDYNECMDRQFNCFVELGNRPAVSDAVLHRALTDAETYDREGNTKSVNVCEFGRKARIYDMQEKLEKMRGMR